MQMTKERPRAGHIFAAALAGLALATTAATAGAQQSPNEKPPVYKSPTGVTLKLILDERNVGPEVTMGELTFPPNIDSGDHVHGSIELLYVLS
jgi:quercetin dioxygenase-like cupin family protein